ncbi:Gfo/Idh/MocA family protein [Luteimonas dalianensis]|uniref:Gfo/Idh/MocA family protein n=1 Tax=Luteimonas dalianensis TaxID=1148196 RepID=UPI003BF1DFC6
MNKPIRIGIVGLGWVSTHRHIPAIRKNPSLKLVGIADRNAELAAQWAKKLGVSGSAADDIEEISWISDVDAVTVATAPMSHYKLISGAIRRGKHVITEKPFAMSVAEGEELVELARLYGTRLSVVHNFQFASAVRRFEADLNSGRIGRIRAILAHQLGNPARRLPTWHDQLPGGLFYDESPHLLYLTRKLSPGQLRLLFVDHCSSTLGKTTPASIDASYRSATPYGEIPVTISCRFESPLSEWHIVVLGDNAAGIIDIFRNIYIRLPNDGSHRSTQVLKTSLLATLSHWGQHFTNGPLHLSGKLLYGNDVVYSQFSQAIHEQREPSGISRNDALDVLRMQWEILDHSTTSLLLSETAL